jgi:hypothetical protein
MLLIQIIIFINILVASEVRAVRWREAQISTRALTGMLKYVDDMFPKTSPNIAFYQPHYNTRVGHCDVLKAYDRLIRESYQGSSSTRRRVNIETQVDIVYNSWGEPTSNKDCKSRVSELFLFIVAIATLIVCSNRRPLTFAELARLQYDPIFNYKYMSGNF